MADTDKLGLGLDDIIRHDRTTPNRRGGRGGRGGFRGRGQNNGFQSRGGGGLPRASNQLMGRWKHDLYDDNNANRTRAAGVSSTTKLLISNLEYGVTTNDVQELFEDIGAVRTARVHFDENGQSLGTAEIIFERRVDAVNAQRKYNGLNLDGRPMDIRLVGGQDDGGSQQQNTRGGGFGRGNSRSGFRNNNQQNGGGRGGGNRARGGGGGRQQQNGNNKKDVTVDDLDADLDAYRAESGGKK